MQMILNTTVALAILSGSAMYAADSKAGKDSYDKACKSCHGADGTPNAGVAKMMKVEMKDLKSSEAQAIGDDDMKKVVTAGKGKMKPISSVTGAAVDNVIAYVRTMKK